MALTKLMMEELKEQVLRLKEDNRVASDREARSEERHRKLVEDVKVHEEVFKTKFAELQRKNEDLERAKTSADARVELYKSRLELLSSMASRMEEDIKVLMSVRTLVSSTRAEEEVGLGPAANIARPGNGVIDGKNGDTRGPHVSVVEISDSDDEPIKENSPPHMLKRKRALLSKSCNGDTWENESDLLLALEKCPELCMRAVCALYRENCFEEIPFKGLELPNCQNTDKPDALRGTMLAKFLIDGNPQARLKKSILELQKHDPRGLEDCKRLSTRYCHKLFEIYTKFRDPFFLPFL